MLTLTIIRRNGVALSAGAVATFGAEGGTIGRADSNRLVLEDPERTVSRIHAQLSGAMSGAMSARGDGFVLLNRGSNPLLVNGAPIDPGQQTPLVDGDEVQIGGYLLRASLSTDVNPRAEQAAGHGWGHAAGRESGHAGGHAAGDADGYAAGRAGGPAPLADDSFADILGTPPLSGTASGVGSGVASGVGSGVGSGAGSGAASGVASRVRSRAPSGIRSGVASAMSSNICPDMRAASSAQSSLAADPLDDPLRPAPRAVDDAAAPFALPDDFGLDAPQLAGSIDELFGLQRQADDPSRENSRAITDNMTDGLRADVIGDLDGPRGCEPSRQPFGAREAEIRAEIPADRRADLHAEMPADPPPALHTTPNAPLIGDPFAEPLSAPNTAQSSDPFASLCGTAPAHAPPPPMRDDSPELHGAFRPPREAHEATTDARAAALPSQAGTAWFDTAARAPANPAPTPAPTDPLRDAFLRGLNLDDARLGPLTPELLERVGALLREATQGTLDLLAARAATRVELHANVTLIAPQQNNPLKFSPNPQAALGHLLHAPIRGFMDGPAALGDAYADLRAHQIGYVAGVKAALDGLVERFSPHTLEQRLSPATLRDSLLPGARRARCWDAFVELYDQIAHEAVDNFHSMLNQAFVDAYDRQVERLRPRK